jgi:hypothetical protein
MANLPKAIATPTKEFFVYMITRDLSITDCILDLVDNAIDQAVFRSQTDVTSVFDGGRLISSLRPYRISVDIAPSSVHVEDNCGGISVEDATNRVFRFGAPSDRQMTGGLSVYGVGMKRAFFKLGRLIAVRSGTAKESFEIDIDVEKWVGEPNVWAFDFKRLGSGVAAGRQGTAIDIQKLRPDIGHRIAHASYQQELRERLASSYALFLSAGLDLRLNGKRIQSAIPEVAWDSRLTPAKKQWSVDGVRILLLAGLSPADDKVQHGWYVFCNGRMVLGPERSSVTGWGGGLPQWHTKFGHFVGYVYFNSEDVAKLPWTTTKRGVTVESAVYQAALREMELQGRPALTFLSRLYSDPEERDPAGRALLHSAERRRITNLPRGDAAFEARLPVSVKKQIVNIQFRRPRTDVDRARSAIGRQSISASKVGEYAFDYFLKNEAE